MRQQGQQQQQQTSIMTRNATAAHIIPIRALLTTWWACSDPSPYSKSANSIVIWHQDLHAWETILIARRRWAAVPLKETIRMAAKYFKRFFFTWAWMNWNILIKDPFVALLSINCNIGQEWVWKATKLISFLFQIKFNSYCKFSPEVKSKSDNRIENRPSIADNTSDTKARLTTVSFGKTRGCPGVTLEYLFRVTFSRILDV